MKRHIIIASAFGVTMERIEHFFTHRGYRVDMVHGGVECIREVQKCAPDALILDWYLPWGGGAGVLACLREPGAAVNVPVILLTEGHLSESDLDVPTAQRLQLPCDAMSLYRAVELVVNSNPLSSTSTSAREQQLILLPAYG